MAFVCVCVYYSRRRGLDGNHFCSPSPTAATEAALIASPHYQLNWLTDWLQFLILSFLFLSWCTSPPPRSPCSSSFAAAVRGGKEANSVWEDRGYKKRSNRFWQRVRTANERFVIIRHRRRSTLFLLSETRRSGGNNILSSTFLLLLLLQGKEHGGMYRHQRHRRWASQRGSRARRSFFISKSAKMRWRSCA